MSGSWKRPESVPYPSVWRRFEGRKKINGRTPKFWIQDLSEDMFEEAIETMCCNYIYEEPISKYSGAYKEQLSITEMKQRWRVSAQDKMTLICFMENPDSHGKPIIAGLNMTYVDEKGKPLPKATANTFKKINDLIEYVLHQKDAYSELGIDRYLCAYGLSVLPEFRGQGIGLELLNSRSDLCRATGLSATLTIFSAFTSQQLAVKSGFKDLVSLTYDEIAEKEPRLALPGISEESKIVRYMYKIID